MVQSFTVIFALVVASFGLSIESSVITAENAFTYLGKFTQTGDDRSTQQTSSYFLSQNAAGWATAGNDCKATLGDTASLANIETNEEFKEVNSFIQSSDDTGSTFWLGGKYDTDLKALVWINSIGSKISTTAPWDQGYPKVLTPATRVLAYKSSRLLLRTEFQTVSLRYICELPA